MQRFAIAVVFVTATAHADKPWTSMDSADHQQPPIEIIPPLEDLHVVAGATSDFDVGVAAVGAPNTSGRAESVVAASIDASAALPYRNSSSFVRGTATAGVRLATDGPGLSFEQHAKARPWAFELFQIETGDRLALDIAPTLSDRPDRWRRRYRSAGFDADVIFLQVIDEDWGVQLCRCDNSFDVERQTDGDVTARRLIQRSDWAPLTFTRRRDGDEIGRIDIVALEARAIGGEHSGAVLTTWYPRIHMPIGPLTVDFAYGHAATGWTRVEVDNKVVSLITSEQLPNLRVPAARARATIALDRFTAGAGVERGMYLAQDARLVVEYRADASLATTYRDTRIDLSGFGAHSIIWTSPTDAATYYTGGGTVRARVPLRGGWELVGQAEVARTFYALLDGDRMPRVDTAVRIDLGLHRELRNWTHH